MNLDFLRFYFITIAHHSTKKTSAGQLEAISQGLIVRIHELLWQIVDDLG